jgi:hypothetical protein
MGFRTSVQPVEGRLSAAATVDAIQLEEVSADQRAPILRAYLQRAPLARPHVPVNKDAALAEFQKVAAAFPVFRIASNKTVQLESRVHALCATTPGNADESHGCQKPSETRPSPRTSKVRSPK